MKWVYVLPAVLLMLSGCAAPLHLSDEQQELSRTYYHLADAQMRLGEYAEAAWSYRRALEIDRDLHSAAYNLSVAYAQIGSYRQALDELTRLLDIDSSNTLLLRQKAWCLLQLDRPDEAEAVYRRALEVDPGDREIQLNLAQLLLEQGALAEARERILDLSAQQGPGETLLRMLYDIDEQAHDRTGIIWLEESWRLFPGDRETAELLSEHYLGTGQLEQAASLVITYARSDKTGHGRKLAEMLFSDEQLEQLSREKREQLLQLLNESSASPDQK